jgi:serine/threonine-protein kinase
VLHRDVKPSNIILTAAGDAKLADFGIAKTLEGHDVTTTGEVVGTIRYMAPERLRGRPATPATDLYSLGMVLREAATGVPPFAAGTPAEVVGAASHGQVAPLLSRDLGPIATVINRASSPRPEDRYASAAEMMAALVDDGRARSDASGATSAVALAPTAAYSPGVEPTVARSSSVVDRAGGRRRRRAGLMLALVLVALITAGALAWSLSSGSDATVPTTVPSTTVPVVATSPPAATGPSAPPAPGSHGPNGHGPKGGHKAGNEEGDQ